jgi:hypothetical protein
MGYPTVPSRHLQLGSAQYFAPEPETPPGNQITVRAGWISKSLDSQVIYKTQQTTVAFNVVGASQLRYDLVYIDKAGTIQVLEGTAQPDTASPWDGAPALPRNTAYPVAYVKVTETASVVVEQDDITDIRPKFHFYEQTPPGTIRNTFKATADEGWLLLNGDTIGDTSSVATYQGEKYRELFDILKLVSPNTGLEDFDTHDTVTLPDPSGKTFVVLDAGDADFDAIGKTYGVKASGAHSHDPATIAVSTEPDHTHTITDHSHTIQAHTHDIASHSHTFGSHTHAITGSTNVNTAGYSDHTSGGGDPTALLAHSHVLNLSTQAASGSSGGSGVLTSELNTNALNTNTGGTSPTGSDGGHTHTLSNLLNAADANNVQPSYVINAEVKY